MPKPKPHSSLSHLTPIDLAWIAGLLEGEGYFCINRDGRGLTRGATLQAGCGMTDRDVIHRLHRLIGVGHISIEKTTNKPVYRWRCNNTSAYALMILLQPSMGQRRQKTIRHLIKWYATKLQALPKYKIRHLPSGRIEEPYVLKDWCQDRGIPFHALKGTLCRGRQPIDGYVREQ